MVDTRSPPSKDSASRPRPSAVRARTQTELVSSKWRRSSAQSTLSGLTTSQCFHWWHHHAPPPVLPPLSTAHPASSSSKNRFLTLKVGPPIVGDQGMRTNIDCGHRNDSPFHVPVKYPTRDYRTPHSSLCEETLLCLSMHNLLFFLVEQLTTIHPHHHLAKHRSSNIPVAVSPMDMLERESDHSILDRGLVDGVHHVREIMHEQLAKHGGRLVEKGTRQRQRASRLSLASNQ